MSEPHPAAQYEKLIAKVQLRGKRVIVALGLTLIHRVCSVLIMMWQASLVAALRSDVKPTREMLVQSDELVRLSALVSFILLITTAVFFIQWLSLTVRLTRQLGSTIFKWDPNDVVWSFFIPFVSFVRPYAIVRDTYDALEPSLVAEPPTQVLADATTGYRDVKVVPPPPPLPLSHASIGAWWTAWWIAGLIATVVLFSSGAGIDELIRRCHTLALAQGINAISAGLAILVVRAVTLRLLERYRRVRHTPAETLEAANILVGAYGDPL